ncbi:hypothetical protein [Neisseria meningitidis]|uniref:hypothetical protein n=1 Tax=Neisseria meningitidis TaxID=487 RepID=UPI001EDF7465|nr:hypothetical protein [Neisseria meningitidis]
MLSQSQWLDAVKGRLRVRSDYALSKRWRLRRPRCPNIGATGCGFLLPSSWILPT